MRPRPGRRGRAPFPRATPRGWRRRKKTRERPSGRHTRPPASRPGPESLRAFPPRSATTTKPPSITLHERDQVAFGDPRTFPRPSGRLDRVFPMGYSSRDFPPDAPGSKPARSRRASSPRRGHPRRSRAARRLRAAHGRACRRHWSREKFLLDEDRKLALRRDGKDVRVRDAERTGLDVVRPHGEELGWLAVPGGAVDDVRPSGATRACMIFPRRKVSRWNDTWPGKRPSGAVFRPDRNESASAAAATAPRGQAPNRLANATRRRASRGRRRPPTDDPGASRAPARGRAWREAVLRILRQAALHDPAQGRRSLRVRIRDRLRLLVQDRRERVHAGLLLERPLARRHLVEDRAEGELVGRKSSGSPARLLRRHVAHRPHHDPRRSSPSRRQIDPAPLSAPCDVSFASPKSRILTSPSFVTMTFSGFRSRWTIPASWALARPSAICAAICSSLLTGSGPATSSSRRVPRRPAPSRCRSATRPPDVVDRDDVGVVQRRGRPRLLLETLQTPGVRGQLRRQHLDRHLARQPRVARPVHLSHPARAQGREHFVGARRKPAESVHSQPFEHEEIRAATA